MRKSLLLLVLLGIFLQSALVRSDCEAQKGFFMSYKAMSKRDTIQNLFTEVNKLVSTYNSTYMDEKNITYTITSFYPQMYYNDHAQ